MRLTRLTNPLFPFGEISRAADDYALTIGVVIG